MNLRRKIAAALAAVMAVGSIGLVDLQARVSYPHTFTTNGVHGAIGGHAGGHRAVDIRSNAWDTSVVTRHADVDFVITGPQLHQQGTGTQTLVLTIDGYGIWNYGAPNITNTAARPTADTTIGDTVIPVQTGSYGRVNPLAAGTFRYTQPWGFFRTGLEGQQGPGGNQGVWTVGDQLTTSIFPGGGTVPLDLIRWSNVSNRAFRVVDDIATHTAWHITDPQNTMSDWEAINLIDGPPITAANWGLELWSLPTGPNNTLTGRTNWMRAIAEELDGEGLFVTPGGVANFFLVPIATNVGLDWFDFVVIEVPANPVTTGLRVVGRFETRGYIEDRWEWTQGTGPGGTAVPTAITQQLTAPMNASFGVGQHINIPAPLGTAPANVLRGANVQLPPGATGLLATTAQLPLGVTQDDVRLGAVVYDFMPDITSPWRINPGWDTSWRVVDTPVATNWNRIDAWTTGGHYTYGVFGTTAAVPITGYGTGNMANIRPVALGNFHHVVNPDGTTVPANPVAIQAVRPVNFQATGMQIWDGTTTVAGVTPFAATNNPGFVQVGTANNTVTGLTNGVLQADNPGGAFANTAAGAIVTGPAIMHAVRQFDGTVRNVMGAPLPTGPNGEVVQFPTSIGTTQFDFIPVVAGGAAATHATNPHEWRLLVFSSVPTASGVSGGLGASANAAGQPTTTVVGNATTGGAGVAIPQSLTLAPATGIGAADANSTELVSGGILRNAVEVTWFYANHQQGGLRLDDVGIGSGNFWNVSAMTTPPWATGGGQAGVHPAQITAAHSIGNVAPMRDFAAISYSGRMHSGAQRNEIPFNIVFEGQNSMRVTWLASDVDLFGGHNEAILRIPMAVQITGVGDIHVDVLFGGHPATDAVGGARQPLTGAGQGVRLHREGAVARGNQSVILPQLRLIESGTGFLAAGGVRNRAFTLSLPYGYVWDWSNTGTHPIGFVGVGRMHGFTNIVNSEAFLANGTRNTMPTSGIPTEGTPFIFTSNDPNTGNHRLHVVMNGWSPQAGGGHGEIWINNLRVAHRNPATPNFSLDEQLVTLENGFGVGFPEQAWMEQVLNAVGVPVENADRWFHTGYNALSNVLSPTGVAAFILAAQNLTLRAAPGARGDLQTVLAGRTYVGPASTNPDIMPGSIDVFQGVTRRIEVEEVVPGAALNRELRFTVTDADGNVSENAKIAAVQFEGGVRAGVGAAGMMNGFPGNRNFHNAVPAIGATHRILGTQGLTGQVVVTFSEDGSSVSVTGLAANDSVNRRMWLEATFFLSTDVNSDEPVYITLSQRGAGMQQFDYDFVYPNATLQIANVTQLFEIEAEYTNIPGRHQRVEVADVTITELVPQAFRTDRQLEVTLSELGHALTRTDVGFNPVNAANVETEGGLGLGVLPRPLGNHAIRLNVNSQASRTTGGSVTLTDLDVFVNQAVPVGTYGVLARGNAILDNDVAEINRRLQGGGANPNAPMWRRYGFAGLISEPYINVTVPGAYGLGGGAINPATAQIVATQNSHIVLVNGTEVAMTNVHGQATPMFHQSGTNFFPMRGIAQVYGSEHAVSWTFITAAGERTVDWAPGVEVEVTVSLGGRTIVFTTGSTTFVVNGTPNTMPAGQTPLNVGGTVFIPFAALGHALGVPVSWEGYGASQQFFFNMPDRGTIVTLNGDVAPEATQEVEAFEDEDYNDYNGYNGDEEDAA